MKRETETVKCPPFLRLGDKMNGGWRFDIYGYPETRPLHARIFPRRKSGEKSRANSQPIVLSRQALEPLFDRPLREAAISLGVSCTALKTICRKLRIERWPFQQSRCLKMRAGKIGACEEAIPPPTIPSFRQTQLEARQSCHCAW